MGSCDLKCHHWDLWYMTRIICHPSEKRRGELLRTPTAQWTKIIKIKSFPKTNLKVIVVERAKRAKPLSTLVEIFCIVSKICYILDIAKNHYFSDNAQWAKITTLVTVHSGKKSPKLDYQVKWLMNLRFDAQWTKLAILVTLHNGQNHQNWIIFRIFLLWYFMHSEQNCTKSLLVSLWNGYFCPLCTKNLSKYFLKMTHFLLIFVHCAMSLRSPFLLTVQCH